MNRLVGEKLSIITSKAQTTRHRIIGIVNTPDYQVVYSDTPGVLRPNYKLQEQMLNFSLSALDDADVLLYVTDVVEKQLEKMVEMWRGMLPKAEIYPISALNNFSIDQIKRRILELLPESPPYFEKDALTDKPARFFVNEIIREKALLLYQKEVPYSIEVMVEEFKEEANIIRIRAIILVERDTQKGIVIGHKGESLKKLGTLARKDIELFFEKKVFLQLYVKVEKDWRNRDNMLKNFGYKLE